MSKEIYLSQLRLKLKTLPRDEVDAAMNYVSEYFLEAGEGNEDKVIAELGTPEKFAAQIKAEYTLKSIEEEPVSRSPRRNIMNIALLVLGIISLPFSLPVIIALLIALLGIVIVILTLGTVAIFTATAGGLTGFSLLGKGIADLFHNAPSGLITTGTALVLLGSVILIIVLCYAILTRVLPYLVRSLGRLFRKAKGEEV